MLKQLRISGVGVKGSLLGVGFRVRGVRLVWFVKAVLEGSWYLRTQLSLYL